jgi:hypothetical protein
VTTLDNFQAEVRIIDEDDRRLEKSILLARTEIELEVKFQEDIGPSSMTRSQLATLSKIE